MKFLLGLFLFVFIIYFLSSSGETPYNYFTRLSASFAQGKLYLEENPPWLNELIPDNGKYYVVYPPMPAIILFPAIFLLGENTPQTLVSIFIGSINIVLVYLLLKRMKFSSLNTLLTAVFFAFGTNHWYLSSIGSAWFIAHIVALFFLLLALMEVFGRQRVLLIGLFIGASFWSRTPILFTVPFFLIILKSRFWPIKKNNLFNLFYFGLGIGLFVLFDGFYNYLRFGNFSPLGPYNLIPGIDNDPIFGEGFMNIKFIPRHIEAFFLRLPQFSVDFPYIIPSLYSMAIWFTSPAIVYALKAKKTLVMMACWVGIIFPMTIVFLWAGVGYTQFGYRFIQDVMPFLLILIASGIGNRPPKVAYLLVLLSIIVNFWGIIMVNKLGIYII